MLTRVRRIWTSVGIAAALLLCSGIAISAGLSVESLANAQLLPSSTPELLGPITEVGRKGWACAPEHAAAATRTSDAALPTHAEK